MSRYNSNYGSHDQLQDLRKRNMILHRELDKWRDLAKMMSHFDSCRSAKITCNICAEARQAYAEALSNG
jgi:hypothetical protein